MLSRECPSPTWPDRDRFLFDRVPGDGARGPWGRGRVRYPAFPPRIEYSGDAAHGRSGPLFVQIGADARDRVEVFGDQLIVAPR